MDKLNYFIQFLIDHRLDERVNIFKKMKYGYRFYHIEFSIDEDPNPKKTNTNHYLQFRDCVEIIFDNRNKCIEFVSGNEYSPIVIESEEMVQKWSEIIEEIVSENIEEKACDLIEKSISQCFNKNLHRELQMKKILTTNEPLQPRRNRKNKQSKGN